MTHPLLTRALPTAVCAVLSVGCQEEPQPLFDEDAGTWVLTLAKVEDGDEIDDLGSAMRAEKFMLGYDKAKKLVAAASCNDTMDNQSIKESLCDGMPTRYACRCFQYEFDLTEMTWTEFLGEGQPMPAEPDEEQQMMGALPFGTPYRISLEAYPGFSNTYRYQPLPFGLFDSNGYGSEYVFQLRAQDKFDATGCAAACGFTSAEAM